MPMRGILIAVAMLALMDCHSEAGSSDAVNTDTCVLIIGNTIDEARMCVDRSSGARIEMGCMDTTMPHATMPWCYENRETSVRAVTPSIFDELLSQGWRDCDHDWYSTVEDTCW